MHHIDLGLFKYQLEFTQDILKKVGGTELQKIFDERLHQIPRFSGLKLLSKLGQLKVMTASDYRHIMKIAIFALDAIFDEWNGITCREICELYAKFNEMYIMSRQGTFTENNLKKFEVIIRNKLEINYLNINAFTDYNNRDRLLIGAPNLKGYSFHYLRRNADILNYIAGGTMQVSFNL